MVARSSAEAEYRADEKAICGWNARFLILWNIIGKDVTKSKTAFGS